ncbi:MAG: hypothetical protein K6C06_04780 [Lachnospiraceae bacterium]|nr:hypothetical protein [Lachnospiraceae bacterium]
MMKITKTLLPVLAAVFLMGTSVSADETYVLYPTDITASSVLYVEGYDYGPWNLVDDSLTVAWCEDVSGNGAGETITYYYPAGTQINQIQVWPGYYKTEDLFYKNGAPSSLKVTCGGVTYTLNTSDYASTYRADGSGCTFTLSQPLVSDGTVTVTIGDVRAGNNYDDTLISELHFIGTSPQGNSSSGSSSGYTGTGDPWADAENADAAMLQRMASRLYEWHTGYNWPYDGSVSVDELTDDDKAFILYWYQYNYNDPRISRMSMYNEAQKSDLQAIMDGMFGGSNTGAMERFLADYAESVNSSVVQMNATGDFGDAGLFYFENGYSCGYDGDNLLIAGDVIAFDNNGYTYIAAPFAAFFKYNPASPLDGWEFVEVVVGEEAQGAPDFFGVDEQYWGTGETSANTGTQNGSGQNNAGSYEELGAKALDYYERTYGYRPGYADTDDNGDGTYTIHLYDITNGHTATSAWYTVDQWGVGTDAIFGDAVDLNS